jgi:beta-mannosidase
MRTLLIIIGVILSMKNFAQESYNQFPFEARWVFNRVGAEGWMDASVPGNVHTDLYNNQQIPNPLTGTNEEVCQWVGEEDWEYQTTSFDCPDEIYNRTVIRLLFHQLDTYATIYLNDQKIISTSNTFRAYEVDVKPYIKKSENVLRIVFKSAVVEGQKKVKALGYKLPGDALRAVSRKPQYHFGWDWGAKLVIAGITGPIEWIAYDEVRISDLYFKQNEITQERALLTAEVTIHSLEDFNSEISITDEESRLTITEKVKIKKGSHTYRIDFDVEEPRLWWCNDHGSQEFYSFFATVYRDGRIIDQKQDRTGLRTIKLITQQDQFGESFYFELNGKPIFAKGANFIPLTMLPQESTRDDYAQLLEMCKGTHFNMLRVWGGGYYEQEEFYDLCDELGIMVWQDFMFACSMYPGDKEFLLNVEEEARQQTTRLRNHPCMALWCGNNENAEGWARWGWQMGLSDFEKAKLEKGYDDVFRKILPNAVAENTNLNYWESSPRYGRGDKKSLTEGDSHYWGLWHDAEPFEILNDRVPRFMSEFGMQSYPSQAVLEEMLTTDKYDSKDPGLAMHQKHGRGFQLMDDYMKRWYEAPSRDQVDAYGELTRQVQCEGMMMGIEAHRRNMPYCMGTLFWQLNDVWPSFSWSAIDYKMNTKPMFDSLYYIYAPQLLSPVVENQFLNVYYIDDVNQDTTMVDLYLTFLDQNGNVLKEEVANFLTVEFGGKILYTKRWSELFPGKNPHDISLSMEIRNLSGETISSRTVRLR